MKRTLKISALALVIAMLCLSFTGCAALDERKDTHAVWTQKGSKDSITYNGEVYKLLEKSDQCNPIYIDKQYVRITEPDVPVLLSLRYGDTLNLSDDKNFISGYFVDSDVCYCKEDIYDEVTQKLEAGIEYTDYFYRYPDNSGKEETDKCEYLSDEDAELVLGVVEKIEAKIDNSCENYQKICTLAEITEDKYFARNKYGVYCDDSGNYYFGFAATTYEIPEKYNSDFDRIFENALEN